MRKNIVVLVSFFALWMQCFQPLFAVEESAETVVSVPDFSKAEKIYTDPVTGKEIPIYYHFSSHLAEAKAQIVQGKDKVLETASWQGEFFEFSQFGSKHRIGFQKAVFDGKEQEGMLLYAVKDNSKVLRFYKLPPKGKLNLFYGIADENQPDKMKQHIYLKIWVGKKMLRRIRIPVEPGWRQKEISLGVVPFLMEPVSVSFEVSSDVTDGQFLFLDAQLV